MNWLLQHSVILLLFCYVSAQEEYVYNADLRISYKFYSIPLTWINAKTICVEDDGRLAMPRNDAEAAEILEIFKQHHSRVPDQDFVVLDSHDYFEENEFITREYNIQYFYHEFDITEPNGTNYEKILTMNINGKLHVRDHNSTFVFICQKEDPSHIENWEKSIRPLFSTDPTYKYHSNSGKYFKLHMFPRTWPFARAICHSEGGKLAIIRSESEEMFLSEMFKDPKNLFPSGSPLGYLRNYALLGFHDLYRSRTFYTITDERLFDTGYVNWAPNEPSDPIGERCGSMDSAGRLNDISCSTPFCFFCERISN